MRRGEHMPLGEHAHRAACTGLPHANHARDGSTEQNRNNQQGHDFRAKPCNLEGACASVWDPRNEATFGREREQVSGVEGMRRNLRKGQRERGAVVSCDLGVWGRTRPAPGVAASLIETIGDMYAHTPVRCCWRRVQSERKYSRTFARDSSRTSIYDNFCILKCEEISPRGELTSSLRGELLWYAIWRAYGELTCHLAMTEPGETTCHSRADITAAGGAGVGGAMESSLRENTLCRLTGPIP